MHQYEVLVGNVGLVWSGTNGAEANVVFGQWRQVSRSRHGRAAGEDVTLMRDGEPHFEHCGRLSRQANCQGAHQ